MSALRSIGSNTRCAALLALCACTGDVGVPSPASDCVRSGTCSPSGSAGSTIGTAGAGDPASVNGIGASTRIARLSNAQWEHTVQDLLALDAPSGLSAAFTQEPADRGYDTEAAAELTVGSDSSQRYQTAAETLASQIASDDAKVAKLAPANKDAGARRDAFLNTFGGRAYRRPLTADELAAYKTLFDAGASAGGGFNAGVGITLEAILQSANFLYRVERSVPSKSGDVRSFLSGYEVASRLSYAIWQSMPNDALLDAAKNGELDSADGVKTWASKMLTDARATPVLLSFLEQTYGVASYGSQDKDSDVGFDAAALAPTLRDEARQFFTEVVLAKGGGLDALLTSNAVYVNSDTAPLYGLTGVSGSALVGRDLPAATRAGLFTQVGFLSKNATRDGSDPVHRGLVILRKVLCDEPNPPPMMFTLPAAIPGLTTRETYERATACGVGCHDTLINPPGFAFESFDTIGRTRTEDAGKPVDTAASLLIRDGFDAASKATGPSDMLSFTGAVDMLQKLSDTPRVHECYARNLMEFVLGRDLSSFERGVSQSLGASSLANAETRDLVSTLVTLDTFRARVDSLE